MAVPTPTRIWTTQIGFFPFPLFIFFGFRWNLVTDHIAPQVKALAAKTDDPSLIFKAQR